MPSRGRGPDPTPEELEFIFGCFVRGLPDSEVREELQGEELPLRDPRTIRKYRRHYDAARKVVLAQEVVATDPVMINARHVHFGKLTDLAKQLMDDIGGEREEIEQYGVPVCHTNYSRSEGESVEVLLQAEKCKLLFRSLREHLAE